MKDLQNILSKITKLTTNIEVNYPELYQYLSEDPITIPSDNNPDIDIKIMNEYLESLKQLLKHHIESHKANKK
ncbi:hypothetical protein [Tenacibaculum adriaticum]|nr:hypothetical protein [Tenacibaculum adriaticum]